MFASIEPRVVTCVHLLQKQNDKAFVVFNAHLDLSPFGALAETTQGKQARILADRIIPRFTDDCRGTWIVMGDFNSNKWFGAPPVLRKRQFKDASGVMDGMGGDDTGTMVGFDPEAELSCIDAALFSHIDWIFAKNHKELGDYKVRTDDGHVLATGAGETRRRLSDHHPVEAVVTLG